MKAEEQLKQTMREIRLSDEAKKRIISASAEQISSETVKAEPKEISLWDKIVAKQKTIMKISIAAAAVFVTAILLSIYANSNVSKDAAYTNDKSAQRHEVTTAAKPYVEMEADSKQKRDKTDEYGLVGKSEQSLFPKDISGSEEYLNNQTIRYEGGEVRFICEDIDLCAKYYNDIVPAVAKRDERIYVTDVKIDGNVLLVTVMGESADSDNAYQSVEEMDMNSMTVYSVRLELDEQGKVVK